MKRKQREVSAFNMSAVDLFASAMGAFILLAVIALPFFPKTSETPPAPVCPDPTPVPTTPVPQACPEPEVLECPVCPDVPEDAFVLKDVDVVIVLDITGSMDESIEGLKSTTSDLAALLNRMAPSFAIGIVVFGDYGFDQPAQQFPLLEINGQADLDRLEQFVSSVREGMGMGMGDYSYDGEAISAGLDLATSMRFRSIAKERRIVVFTDDAPTYQSRAIDLARRFGSGSTSGVSQTVSVVLTDSKNNPDARPVLEEIAREGGGFFSASSGSFIGKLLLALLDS
ncbi:MAG: VWA domain-containing protein [Gammaproteobacteria bacterium]|jgi:hypothetical protein|nr:VWA domain-containing protein [Gammaproteobacteria bacterium]